MTTPKLAPLTRAKALEASKNLVLATESVEVPELGGSLTIRQFAAADTDFLERYQARESGKGRAGKNQMRAQIVIRACVLENGERLFSQEDADTISLWPIPVLNRVLAVLNDLNGGEDIEEVLEKNSGKAQKGGSASS